MISRHLKIVHTWYTGWAIQYPRRHTERKLNIHKKFRRHPGRLLNILCTFNVRPVSTGILIKS